jgi:hypothetical protein
MTPVRMVEPEWLDDLPAGDPRAIHSRRDLRRLNGLMFQAPIMAALLSDVTGSRTPAQFLEIGAGDGAFTLSVARRLARRVPQARIILLDRQDCANETVVDGFRALGWDATFITADAFEFLKSPGGARFDAIAANLFLHHFQDAPLAELMALAARRCEVFAACEPRRSGVALAACRLLWAIGCNDVTRHDARASVLAGFGGRELSDLWPSGRAWSLQEAARGPFTHTLLARRFR